MRIETTSAASTAGAGEAEESKVHKRPKEPPGGTKRKHVPRETASDLPQKPRVPEPPQHSLSIQIDQHRRVFYQVIDARTGEVVRQIPPEEVRRAGEQVDELLRRQESRGQRQIDLSS